MKTKKEHEKGPGAVPHNCNPTHLGGGDSRITIQVSSGKNARLYQRITKAKRAGDVVYVAEHLPGRCEALSSNHSTTKKEERKEKEMKKHIGV
jgi:hypothetical protein